MPTNFQEIDLEASRILNLCYERAKEVKEAHITKTLFIILISLCEESHNSLFCIPDSAAKPKAYGCLGC